MSEIRNDFPIFKSNPGLVYLDNASSTQKPKFVIDEVNDFVSSKYSNIHRGNYDLSYQAEQLYLYSKKLVGKLINCSHQEIFYHYNATACSNIIAQSICNSGLLGKGDSILLGIRDHHANIVVWQSLQKIYGFDIKYIPIDDISYGVDREKLAKLDLSKVKLLACSHVSNVTGTIYDVKKIRSFLSKDSLFILDGSQSVPNFYVDVQDVGCDCLFFTAHKMMAYTGLGVGYIKKDFIQHLNPIFVGGGVIQDVNTSGYTLVSSIEKFESGTPNIIGAISLGSSLKYFEWIGGYSIMKKIEGELIDFALQKTSQLDSSIKLIGNGSVEDRVAIFSFSTKNNALDISDQMAENNVCIRTGGHCAHPLLYHLNQKKLIRMSAYIYNNKSDLERFFDNLK